MAKPPFVHSSGLKVGDTIDHRGQLFTVVKRDEDHNAQGKLISIVFKFESTCMCCGETFTQFRNQFEQVRKSCSNVDCRKFARSAGARAAAGKLAESNAARKGKLITGGIVEWDGEDAPPGTILAVRNGRPAMVSRIDGPFEGPFSRAPYYIHVLAMRCNRCDTSMERTVYLKVGGSEKKRWVRAVCETCAPKKDFPEEIKARAKADREIAVSVATKAKADGRQYDDFKDEISTAVAAARTGYAQKRAEEINVVVEKAQMVPAATTNGPQKSPTYDLAQAWQRLKEASERLNVQPKLGYLKTDLPEVRRILATRGPGLPALLNPLVQGVLAELDKLA